MPELNNLQDIEADMIREFKNNLLGEETISLYLGIAYTLGERNQIKEQLDKINKK